jgi:hypothetical protein
MSLWFEDYLIKNFGAALMGADFTRMTFTPFVIPNVFVSTNMFPDRPGVAPDAIDYIVTYSRPEKRRLFIVTDEYSARFCNKITRALSNVISSRRRCGKELCRRPLWTVSRNASGS